jgi:hypothetical protein
MVSEEKVPEFTSFNWWHLQMQDKGPKSLESLCAFCEGWLVWRAGED